MPYFHITITVPAELRAVLRANQRDGYGVLMQACAAAIIELARDPRYVGDQRKSATACRKFAMLGGRAVSWM